MYENLKKYIKGDTKIWGIIIFLSVASILVVFSATGDLAYKYRGGNTSYYMFKQLGSMITGILIIIAMSNIPYRYYSRFSTLFLYLSIGLLIYALFFGINLNEATRWVRVPFIGLKFQPSELAKIAIILFVARMLAQNQNDKEALKKSFFPIIIHTTIVFLLIVKDNFSTAVLIFGVVFLMLIIGRMPFKYIFGTGFCGVIILILILLVAPKLPFMQRGETWEGRFETFKPFSRNIADNQNNYQLNQAKIAIASGGFLGKGPGNSEQRNFLPHPYSDFIYAIIAEEYGFWGALLTLGAYLYFLRRIGVIVRKSTKAFPAFMTLGLGLLIVSQAILNMAVSVGILPVTGQPLPLLSMGTTSIVSSCIALGAILSVSEWNRFPQTSSEAGGDEEHIPQNPSEE